MDGADGLPDDAVEAIDSRRSRRQQDQQDQQDQQGQQDQRGQEGQEGQDAVENSQDGPNGNDGGSPNFNDNEEFMPSRWWFAASAFPMAAGTLGPIASAFSICALVRPWRQEIKPGQTIESASFIKDPVWLTTINAIQLFIALVANLFLLLNMARRIRFVIAQPVTMLGWFFSSLALIALTATAAGPLQDASSTVGPDSTMVWSQSFFYAIYAAVLYMLVASLMAVTFAGAREGHYPKDFQLSNSQRTLMLQTIMVLMYLLVGAVVFSHLEGWAYLDAVYWADVTLFTVGFGDFAAETTAGRALLFPYALVGIISLGLVIGSIRSLALEHGRRRLNARMTEKNRRKFLMSLAKQGKDDILQPIQDYHHRHHHHHHDRDRDRDTASVRSSIRSSFINRSRPRTATGLTEYERREEEFKIMRRIQHNAATARRWLAMATSGGIWVALWLIGAWVFQACEHPYQGWDYFDGFYLSFVSLTTIGYGDMTPISNAGRSFFVFWSLLALPATTILISNAGDTIVKSISDATNAIGRITILPGERGLKKDLKEMARALTCGAILFDDVDIEEAPPGLLGAAQQTEGEREDSIAGDEEIDEEEAEQAVNEAEMSGVMMNEKDGSDNGSGSGTGSGRGRSQVVSDAYSAHREAMLGGGDGPATEDTASTANENENEGETAKKRSTPNKGTRTHSSDQGLHSAHQRSATWAGTKTPLTKKKKHAGPGSDAGQLGYALNAVAAVSMPRTDIPPELPRTRAEYHCVLIEEIARVTEHLRHSPPRKYTFQEWAWFLRLIGEDEHNAEHHRKAKVQPKDLHRRRHGRLGSKGGGGGGGSGGDEHDELDEPDESSASEPTAAPESTSTDHPSHHSEQWSWVGARSPLMSSQEEAEWILDRLTKRLRAELAAVAKDAEAVASRAESSAVPCYDEDGPSKTGRGPSGDPADPDPYVSSHVHQRGTHPIAEEP